jgi:hypothetical protein
MFSSFALPHLFSCASQTHIDILHPSFQREDLEFSVGSKAAVWEVKDPLLAPSGGDYDEDSSSAERYPVPPPLPGYPSSFSGGQQQQQQHGGGIPYPGYKTGGGGPGGNAPSLVGGVSGQQLYGAKGGQRYPPGSGERY